MNIFAYLERKGFSIIEQKVSNSFGNYYYIFSNNDIKLRLIKDRSQIIVDVSNAIERNGKWFDLSLVKAFITNDTKRLNCLWTIKQYTTFLTNNMSDLLILFNKENYILTEKKLDELRNERAKQIFSTLINE
jgi:hypothetical protein